MYASADGLSRFAGFSNRAFGPSFGRKNAADFSDENFLDFMM
jgi:hypothetical protein